MLGTMRIGTRITGTEKTTATATPLTAALPRRRRARTTTTTRGPRTTTVEDADALVVVEFVAKENPTGLTTAAVSVVPNGTPMSSVPQRTRMARTAKVVDRKVAKENLANLPAKARRKQTD